MLEQLQAYPAIWNKETDDYKLTGVRAASWEEICDHIKSISKNYTLQGTYALLLCCRSYFDFFAVLVHDLKKRWKTIRDAHNRSKREGPTGSASTSETQSKYDPYLSFLKTAKSVRK